MNVETANRLQNLRKKNGYSQEELAEKIGISRQAVSKWERAEASPDTDNLILLAKLYGVTLDELLNTESVPLPNSEGISLSKDYYTSVSDDGEIYPEGHPKHTPSNDGEVMPSGANSTNKTETAENSANETENNEPKPTVGDVVKNVAGAIGDAIDTTAASIREGKANAPQDGSDNGKSYADAFEKNFKDFGKRMKTFGENLEKDMNRMGKDIEKSVENAFDENFEKNMSQMGKDIEASVKKTFSEGNEHISRHEECCQRHENHERKYPATLLDKLFPFLVTGFFLFTVFYAKWTVKYTWLVFLTIPVYYILSQAFKNLTHGKLDPLHALKSFLDGSLPILVVFFYLALGLTADVWVHTLFLFALIPVYYIFSSNFFSWLDGNKSFGRAVKGFFDGSVPILAVMIFFLSFYFGFEAKNVLIFAIIPFYYIISSHFAEKKQK